MHLAYLDVKNRYRRTLLGPFWAVLSALLFIISLGIVYSLLWQSEVGDFLPYFSAGYITWLMMTSVANEATISFSGQGAIIKHTRNPLALHLLRLIARNFIVFLHMLPVHFGLMMYFGKSFSLESIALLIPGFAMFGLLLLSASIVLGIVAARYRDLAQVVQSILQFAFFVTPIVWKADLLAGKELPYLLVVVLNPFYHTLELVRRPLIGETASLMTWAYCSLLAILLVSLALFLLGRYRNRIVFWI